MFRRSDGRGSGETSTAVGVLKSFETQADVGVGLAVVFIREGKFIGRVPLPHSEGSFLKVLRLAGLE